MEKSIRSKIYVHIDYCVEIIGEAFEVWVATEKNPSLISTYQKEWDAKLSSLDNTIGLVFGIFQEQRKEIKHENIRELLLKVIQDVSNFIKFNKVLKTGDNTQMKAIGELAKELAFFEKKLEQHVHTLN